MFKVKRVGDSRLDIELSGKIDADDMRKALDDLVENSAGIENGTMLYDVVDFKLPTLAAITVEFSRLPKMLKMINRFSRAAVLTDKEWIKKASELEGKLIPRLEIKAFSRDERAAAEQWLDDGDIG